jgi:hypothetical protein
MVSIYELDIHPVIYYERYCRICRKNIRQQVRDYGLLKYKEFDSMLGRVNYPITPFPCPSCSSEEMPEYVLMEDRVRNAIILKKRIGTADIPVIDEGNSSLYGVTRSQEEHDIYLSALERMEEVFKSEEEEFWDKYYSWAKRDWRKALSELNLWELKEGLSLTSPGDSRRKLLKLAEEIEDKKNFWIKANKSLIDVYFRDLPPDQWDLKILINNYGKNRIMYLIYNFPLPLEFEAYRLEKIYEITPKESQGAIFSLIQRLNHLQKRNEKLSRILQNLKQENGRLIREIQELKNKLDSLSLAHQSNGYTSSKSLKHLKSLVKEFYEENKKLRQLLSTEPPTKEQVEIKETPQQKAGGEEEINLNILNDKTILVCGLRRETVKDGYTILWHEGNKVDYYLLHLARLADVMVILTRFSSHEAMWTLKEMASERKIPILFLRETGIRSITREAAKVIGTG